MSVGETIQLMILDDLRKKMSEGTPRNSSVQRKLSNAADREDEDESHLTRQETTISARLMANNQSGIPLRSVRHRRLSDDRINLTRILLTGGPCAGKSTAIAAIS